jgi:hypothetical protein
VISNGKPLIIIVSKPATAYEEEEFLDEKTGRIIHIVPAYVWLLQG